MGRMKEWAMQLAAEGPLSTCCGAQPLGDTHETCGHHMGFCSDCREHAEFVGEEDQEEEPKAPTVEELAALQNQINKESEELDKIANLAKVEPIGADLLKEIGKYRYNAVIQAHGAHESGDKPEQQYYNGRIDAFDAAYNLIKRHFGIIS